MDVNAASRRPAAPSRLNGAPLDRLTLLLLSAGAAGALLFTAIYLVEGVTRPGYDAWVQPISTLSLGPGGWVQQASFVGFGIVTILCSATAWRRVLAPGRGATLYPLLRVVEGLGLVVVGIFSTDPGGGFPPGAVAPAVPSLHGEIHVLASYVSFTSLLGTAVLAWRFAAEPLWRGWAWPTVLFAVLPVACVAAFGATFGHAPSGVFERLASTVGLPLGLAILGRLLHQVRARACRRPLAAARL